MWAHCKMTEAISYTDGPCGFCLLQHALGQKPDLCLLQNACLCLVVFGMFTTCISTTK